jgi:hypothetical protein
MSNNIKELVEKYLKNQRKDIEKNIYKLYSIDILKVISLLGDIFDTNECIHYYGNYEKKNKTKEVIIFINGLKQSLMRLLYHNFIEDISNCSIKNNRCDSNKSKLCFNINHMKKNIVKCNLNNYKLLKEKHINIKSEKPTKYIILNFN